MSELHLSTNSTSLHHPKTSRTHASPSPFSSGNLSHPPSSFLYIPSSQPPPPLNNPPQSFPFNSPSLSSHSPYLSPPPLTNSSYAGGSPLSEEEEPSPPSPSRTTSLRCATLAPPAPPSASGRCRCTHLHPCSPPSLMTYGQSASWVFCVFRFLFSLLSGLLLSLWGWAWSY